MSAAAFARREGIKYATFCAWRAQTRTGPGFVEVELAPMEVKEELMIELGPMARMRVGSAGQVVLAAQLLRVLNGGGPC